MKKPLKRVICCFLAAVCFWSGGLLADRQRLDQQLLRFHVVANSDSAEDQAIKLKVRDAVAQSLESALEDASDLEAAETYIRNNLGKIQRIADAALKELGCEDGVKVTLDREKFDARFSDALALPAGFYHALRITIGDGEGKNWWGVLFPDLCSGAVAIEEQPDVPASAAGAVSRENESEIRFYLLDKLGQLENRFRKD